jgi:hypothetical protein
MPAASLRRLFDGAHARAHRWPPDSTRLQHHERNVPGDRGRHHQVRLGQQARHILHQTEKLKTVLDRGAPDAVSRAQRRCRATARAAWPDPAALRTGSASGFRPDVAARCCKSIPLGTTRIRPADVPDSARRQAAFIKPLPSISAQNMHIARLRQYWLVTTRVTGNWTRAVPQSSWRTERA